CGGCSGPRRCGRWGNGSGGYRGRSRGWWGGGCCDPPPVGCPRAAGRGSVLDEGLEGATAQRVAKLAERLGLDLPDPLARHREALAHFLQGVLPLLADAEAQAENLLLLGRERAERTLDLVGQVLADQRLVGRLRA